jgi:hypothetical protein
VTAAVTKLKAECGLSLNAEVVGACFFFGFRYLVMLVCEKGKKSGTESK